MYIYIHACDMLANVRGTWVVLQTCISDEGWTILFLTHISLMWRLYAEAYELDSFGYTNQDCNDENICLTSFTSNILNIAGDTVTFKLVSLSLFLSTHTCAFLQGTNSFVQSIPWSSWCTTHCSHMHAYCISWIASIMVAQPKHSTSLAATN